MSLQFKTVLLLGLVLVGFVMPRFLAHSTIEKVKIGSPLYQDIDSQKSLITELYAVKADVNAIRAAVFNLIDENDPQRRQQVDEGIEQLEGHIHTQLTALVKRSRQEMRPALEKLQQQVTAHDEAIDKQVKPLAAQKNDAAAREVMTHELGEVYQSIIAEIDRLRAQAEAAVKAEEGKSVTIIKDHITTAMVISLLVFIVVSISMVLLLRSLRYSLQGGATFAKAVSDGDLTKTLDVTSRDEFGDLAESLNDMVAHLSGLVMRVSGSAQELREVSGNLTLAAGQVTRAVQTQQAEISESQAVMQSVEQSVVRVGDGVEVLSASAQETASAVQQIAASIDGVAGTVEQLAQVVDEVSSSVVEIAASIRQVEGSVMSLMDSSSVTASSVLEMDASIRQVQDNARTTAQIAVAVQEDAETGRQAMEATMAGMTEIRRSSRITYEAIESLSAKTGDIGAILSVIDEVAEQTNLLALNAAIIAAQAGEHGKGFAVVADEIKELAERTTSSTKEIADVIKAVQGDMTRAVESINLAERVIKDGEFLSGRSAEAQDKIVRGVRQASERMHQIAVATTEQSKGSQVIRQAIEQMSNMIEQIASATREQARGGDMIIAATEKMKSLTEQVKSATQEQRRGGTTIGAQTERVLAIVATIRNGCLTQRQEGERVAQALEGLHATSAATIEANAILGQAVQRISRQSEVLQQELDAFKLEK